VCTSKSPPVGTGDKQYACALLPANILCLKIAHRQHLTRAFSLKAFASKAKAIAAATQGGLKCEREGTPSRAVHMQKPTFCRIAFECHFGVIFVLCTAA